MAFFYKAGGSGVKAVPEEAARYSGFCGLSKRLADNEDGQRIMSLVNESCEKLQRVLVPQAVYEEFDLLVEPVAGSDKCLISFADISFESRDLGRNLLGCKKVVLLAATVGARVDMLIRRAQQAGSADAAIMQGTGAMFIESFVDDLNARIKADCCSKNLKVRPRYSPGYGDVPVSLQKDFFRLLPCAKIGLSLMDTMIMAPEKSVTAFIGVE